MQNNTYDVYGISKLIITSISARTSRKSNTYLYFLNDGENGLRFEQITNPLWKIVNKMFE